MDFESLVKKKNKFEEMSLEDIFMNLLDSIDDDLKNLFAKALEKLNGSYENMPVERFTALLDLLLPDVPSSEHVVVIEEKLIEKVVHLVLFVLFLHCHKEIPVKKKFASLVLRVVNQTPYRVLSDEKIFLGHFFGDLVLSHMEPACKANFHVIQNIFCILLRRLSTDDLDIFLTQPLLFQFRQLVHDFPKIQCSQLKELRALYLKLDVDKMFSDRNPTWRMLTDSYERFQSNDYPKALELLSRAVEEESLYGPCLVNSGVASSLERKLARGDQFDGKAVVKFLEVFLKLSHSDDEVPGSLDGYLFEKLACDLIDSCSYMFQLVNRLRRDRQGRDVIKTLDDNMSSVLSLLNCLYVLNRTWYQWFDLPPSDPIMDEDDFASDLINDLYKSDKIPNLRVRSFFDIIKKCPAILSLDLRENFTKKYVFDVASKEVIVHEITRENPITDLLDLFSKFPKELRHYWDFSFRDEDGQGVGPTKEFYSLISQEVQKHDMDMWLGDKLETKDGTLYTQSSPGLFPKISEDVVRSRKNFVFFGKLLAKTMHDDIFLGVPLSDAFIQRLTGDKLSHLRKDYYDIPSAFPMIERFLHELIWVKRRKNIIRSDPFLSEGEMEDKIKSLTFSDGQSFEDLCLNFTVPGSEEELIEGGCNVMLSPSNLEEYLEALSSKKSQMDPSVQIEAVREGINQIFPMFTLNMFHPEELKRYWCSQSDEEWTVDYLIESCAFGDGYSEYSEPVRFLFQVMSSFSIEEKKMFLQFATSSSSMPVGGLAALEPPLTVVKKANDDPDHCLPSVSTCNNIIFLPEYKSLQATKEKLSYAILEGRNAFLIV